MSGRAVLSPHIYTYPFQLIKLVIERGTLCLLPEDRTDRFLDRVLRVLHLRCDLLHLQIQRLDRLWDGDDIGLLALVPLRELLETLHIHTAERLLGWMRPKEPTFGMFCSISVSSSFSRFFSPTIAVMPSISRWLSCIFFSSSCDFSYAGNPHSLVPTRSAFPTPDLR